jgi:hypothetical protein
MIAESTLRRSAKRHNSAGIIAISQLQGLYGFRDLRSHSAISRFRLRRIEIPGQVALSRG